MEISSDYDYRFTGPLLSEFKCILPVSTWFEIPLKLNLLSKWIRGVNNIGP